MAVLATRWLQDNPERYSPAAEEGSLWESSTVVASIHFASCGRAEDELEKVSPEGARLFCLTWVGIALCARGTRLVDGSGGCGGSDGFTDAGSNLIDMGNQSANSQSIGSSGRSPKNTAVHSWRGKGSCLSGLGGYRQVVGE